MATSDLVPCSTVSSASGAAKKCEMISNGTVQPAACASGDPGIPVHAGLKRKLSSDQVQQSPSTSSGVSSAEMLLLSSKVPPPHGIANISSETPRPVIENGSSSATGSGHESSGKYSNVRISSRIAGYLETVFVQYSENVPDWVLLALRDNLGIELSKLKAWFKRRLGRSATVSQSKELAKEISVDEVLARVGYQGPSAYSLDCIHKLVSLKQSADIQSLMLQQYGHSLQYLVMTLFSHDAVLQNESVDLDQEVRNSALMSEKYGNGAAEMIQILYHRVCDLESHLIYMSVDEQEYLARQRLLCAEIERLRNLNTQILLQADPNVTNDSWKQFQRKSFMINSEDIYAEHGVAYTPRVPVKHEPPPILQNSIDTPMAKKQRTVSPVQSADALPLDIPISVDSAILKTNSHVPTLSVCGDPIPPHELDALVACIEAAEAKSNTSISFDYNGNNVADGQSLDENSVEETSELFDPDTAHFLEVDNKFFQDHK